MVKLYCDKCGNPIVDHYFTVDIVKHNVSATTVKTTTSYEVTGSTLNGIVASFATPYDTLSKTKMYCPRCKQRTEHFLNSNPASHQSLDF